MTDAIDEIKEIVSGYVPATDGHPDHANADYERLGVLFGQLQRQLTQLQAKELVLVAVLKDITERYEELCSARDDWCGFEKCHKCGDAATAIKVSKKALTDASPMAVDVLQVMDVARKWTKTERCRTYCGDCPECEAEAQLVAALEKVDGSDWGRITVTVVGSPECPKCKCIHVQGSNVIGKLGVMGQQCADCGHYWEREL